MIQRKIGPGPERGKGAWLFPKAPLSLAVILFFGSCPAAAAADPGAVGARHYDLVVVGGTPAGIVMAVRAARGGATVLLVNHNAHLGGMLSSGLGVWDTLHMGRRSPLYDYVRQAIFDHYRRTYGENSPQFRHSLPAPAGHANGKFEPRVAERILTELVTAEKRVTLLKGYVPVGAEREGAAVRSLAFRETDGTRTVRATGRIFADCTYEADLLPLVKVRYRFGRESRSEFNEPHAGVAYFRVVRAPPTPAEKRIAEVHARLNLRTFPDWEILLPASTGEADANVQACNYRTILTSDPANRVAIEKPANYDPDLVRDLEMPRSGIGPIPNAKIGLNRPQLIGPHNAWVEGDGGIRRAIMDRFWHATMSAVWFRQHDPSVPEEERRYWLQLGLPRDEFADNGHRPYEFYFREGRRLTGRAIYTEQDVRLPPGLRRAPVHADAIAITDWYVDSHACTMRTVEDSMPEGRMMLHNESFPGQLPYRTLLPEHIDNLLVPVNVSSTHVAWNTIRLEATWMHIAESAAHAALQSLREGRPPARIESDTLLRTLAANHIMLAFFNDLDVSSDDPAVAASQYFGTKGFFADYDARLGEPLKRSTAKVWGEGFRRLRAAPVDAMALMRAVHAGDPADDPAVPASEFAALIRVPLPEGSSGPRNRPFTRGEAMRLMWEAVVRKR